MELELMVSKIFKHPPRQFLLDTPHYPYFPKQPKNFLPTYCDNDFDICFDLNFED